VCVSATVITEVDVILRPPLRISSLIPDYDYSPVGPTNKY
jgi:hypothetical protein